MSLGSVGDENVAKLFKDARETSPARTHKIMCVGNCKTSNKGTSIVLHARERSKNLIHRTQVDFAAILPVGQYQERHRRYIGTKRTSVKKHS
jgi:hypothetical protein